MTLLVLSRMSTFNITKYLPSYAGLLMLRS